MSYKNDTYLEALGVERFEMYKFEVVSKNYRGIRLQCIDFPEFEAFAFFDLAVGSTLYASIKKVLRNAHGVNIIVMVETVLSYAEPFSQASATANPTALFEAA